MVEHLFCKQDVGGSIPLLGSLTPEPRWQSRQSHQSVKLAPQGYGGANPPRGTTSNVVAAFDAAPNPILVGIWLCGHEKDWFYPEGFIIGA